jgi:hypothetical protein
VDSFDQCWGLQSADTDEVGHAFQYDVGHLFRSEVGHHSEMKPAT